MNKKRSIEFCIQPPSPPLLPGISSILLYEQDDDKISLISPTASSSSSCLPPLSPNNSIYSNHSNLEAVEPFSNSFHDRSPSLSPFTNPVTLNDTPTNNTPFLLPPPVRSNSVSDDESVKRKRGRRPNTAKNQTIKRNSWTFVTPTVWNVHQQNEAMEQEKYENVIRHSYQQQQQQQQESAQNTTFTNTNMDTTLSMPKKKRGRKPKMQLAGNFCFVWRESTSSTTNKQQK